LLDGAVRSSDLALSAGAPAGSGRSARVSLLQDCPRADVAKASLDQRSNLAQELLFLWAAAGSDQKSSYFNVGDLAP
jgi:hypothetical protein